MERLAEVALRDADPDTWTAAHKPLKDMTKAERGDAAWCRKTAIMTITLTVQLQRLYQQAKPLKPSDTAPSMDEELARAEAAARDLLERVGTR